MCLLVIITYFLCLGDDKVLRGWDCGLVDDVNRLSMLRDTAGTTMGDKIQDVREKKGIGWRSNFQGNLPKPIELMTSQISSHNGVYISTIVCSFPSYISAQSLESSDV